jgi:6-phosphogluconolactonase/glucosamine-6-phosphate isomerase/deaminase
MQNFYYRIDEDLRPARSHMNYPTHENINRYGDMIADLGGADVCYAPIGWSGHVAFIEPDEFKGDLEEWKKSGPKLVDLSPFTILQNSLFSDFGEAGDWSWIPPKAVTIGPAEIVNSKLVCSWNGYFGEGKNVTWQKFIVRLAVHGPVTTKVPASILQTLHTNFHISDKIATNITAEIDY